MLFLCLFIGNSLPTLVNISSLQQCFLALAAITYDHSKIKSLVLLKFVLGYNYAGMVKEDGSDMDERIENLNFCVAFLNNFNVMLLIQTLLTISIVLLFYSNYRFNNCKKWLSIMKK